MSQRQQEDAETRPIDRQFLVDCDIPEALLDETLLALEKNDVLNVASLVAILSEDELRSLNAKNDQGEVVTLGIGTVGLLWTYIKQMKRGLGAHAPGSSSSRMLKVGRTNARSLKGVANVAEIVACTDELMKAVTVAVEQVATAATAAIEQVTGAATAVLSSTFKPNPSAKRSFGISCGSDHHSMRIEAVVYRAHKRANLLAREHLDIAFEREIPREVEDCLVPLLNGKGVPLQDLQRMRNVPRYHQCSAPNTPVPPNQLQRVSPDTMGMLALDPDNLQLLVCKGGSMVYAVNGSVLKRVHSSESFGKELEAMKAIARHTNVTSLIASDPQTRHLLIAPLGDFNLARPNILQNGVLSLRQLENGFAGVLDGLQHVHRQGWLHRDVRPENIVVCQASGQLVLIDLGLAVRGPTYESNRFSGYLKFAAEEHLDQTIQNSEKPFKWDAATDINALFLVGAYLQRSFPLDFSFEKFMQAAEAAETRKSKKLLQRVLDCRIQYYSDRTSIV